MNSPIPAFEKLIRYRFAIALLIVHFLAFTANFWAQGSDVLQASPQSGDDLTTASNKVGDAEKTGFRIEKVPVAGGAEILTIFARPGASREGKDLEVPMVSVLRDTLGDNDPENNQLRYVWMLSYVKPSARQKLAAFVPFLYSRAGNNKNAGTGPPRPIADIRRSDKAAWDRVLWTVAKKLILEQAGVGARSSVMQFRQNSADYRRSSITRALSILALYQSVNREKLLSDAEMKDIQARLWLTDKTFGWHMQNESLSRVYEKEVAKAGDIRGHNWELLRQVSEAQGLYFEPLEMADGVARHAIIWTTAEDVAAHRGRKFDSRFLNINNPWNDKDLQNWKDYSQVRWYDGENRVVEEGTPEAKPKTMIPLAIYGLDNPKIPSILVDFRDNGNPKRREISRRILNDITGNILSLSSFSSLPYFLGRYIYDYATGKRGMDINQASRVKSYAQLKTLLSLDASLDNKFRDEISDRLENVSVNPLENDLDFEAKLARQQYDNLMDYAKRPDGLPAQLDRERREEMVKLAHGGKQLMLFKVGHYLSLTAYTHRERSTPELIAAMNVRRQLEFHERFIREVAFATAKPEVDTDVAALRRSLEFVAQYGEGAKEKTTRALATIFSTSGDEDVRSLCVTGLYRIDNSSAKNQLLSIYDNSNVAERWRSMSAHYLKQALSEGKQMYEHDAETIAAIGTN